MPIPAGEPGIRVAVGVQGSGKTWRLIRGPGGVLESARLGVRTIVLDPAGDWSEEPYDRIPRDLVAVTRRLPTVREAIERLDRGELRIAVVRGRTSELPDDADAACAWVVTKPRPDGVRAVVVHEAHFAFPVNMPLPPHVLEAVTTWRHVRAALYIDSQRFAQFSRAFDTAEQLDLFAQSAGDMERVRALGGRGIDGRALESAIRDIGKRFARPPRGLGEKGWHVPLSSDRFPPYDIVRC